MFWLFRQKTRGLCTPPLHATALIVFSFPIKHPTSRFWWIPLASRHCAFPEFIQILGPKNTLSDVYCWLSIWFTWPVPTIHLLCKPLIFACYLIFSQVHYDARGTCSKHDMFIKAVISWAQKPFCIRTKPVTPNDTDAFWWYVQVMCFKTLSSATV